MDPVAARRDTVGRTLRRAREREGLHLQDVSSVLRIRYDYLDAIERSEFDRLPGGTYAIGFVRSYASYLELDEQEVVRRFKDEVAGFDQTQDLHFPEPVNEGKIPGRALLLISLILILAAYGGWYYLTEPGDTVSDMVPPVPDRLEAWLSPDATEAGGDTVSDFAGSSQPNDSAATPPEANGSGATAVAPADSDTAGASTPQVASKPANEGADPDGESTAANESSVPETPAPETAGTPSETGRTDGGTEARNVGTDAPAAPQGGSRDGETQAAATSANGGDVSEATQERAQDTGQATDQVSTEPAGAEPGSADPDAGADGGARIETAALPEPPETATQEPVSGSTPSGESAAEAAEGTAAGAEPAQQTPQSDDTAAASVPSNGNGSAIPQPPASGGADTSDRAEDDAADGVPEPPAAADDGSPEAPGSTETASAAGGAQDAILNRAERVFGRDHGDSRVLLRATRDSWVQVRGPDDSLLLTRVLNAGDVYRVPDRQGLVLHTGNAGGLEVYIDGGQGRRLGETGEVRRNISLDPGKLR